MATSQEVVASGTVRIRALDGGREWDERVEVFERDLDRVETPEDAARNAARRQCDGQVETLEVDVQ